MYFYRYGIALSSTVGHVPIFPWDNCGIALHETHEHGPLGVRRGAPGCAGVRRISNIYSVFFIFVSIFDTDVSLLARLSIPG
jgi:hypothetical protein